MRANPIAFELTVGTSYVRASSARLLASVTVVNTTAARTAYLSTDAGSTRASLPTNVPVRLERINLNELYVAASSSGTVVSFSGNSPAD
jgi:hypothetical protein